MTKISSESPYSDRTACPFLISIDDLTRRQYSAILQSGAVQVLGNSPEALSKAVVETGMAIP
jgi:hypothetical protein